MSSRRIDIFDTTLRDGEQSPGIALQPHEKVEIAGQLERLGVDVIEAGFAASSPGDFEGVRAVARSTTRAAVATLCRTRREDIDAGAEALAAGADAINLPDTVGYVLPAEYASFLGEVRRLCPELRGVVLSAHCHDDLGLAVSNSLAAVQAGAGQVECTVNGIGERGGNASLEEIVMALRVRQDHFGVDTGIDTSEIAATSSIVELATGYAVPPNKAIVGANAFAHEAGIHQDGLLEDVATYQIMEPAELGFVMTLPLGKHSGHHSFAIACTDAGFALEGAELSEAFARFKALSDSGRPVSIHEVLTAEVTVQ